MMAGDGPEKRKSGGFMSRIRYSTKSSFGNNEIDKILSYSDFVLLPLKQSLV
jgi:hypothetical protein